MEPLLPQTEHKTKEFLKVVYDSLDKLEKKASKMLAKDSGIEADYTVLVPGAEEREPLTVEVYSDKKKWSPGHEPCCGEKLFNLKKFRLVSVVP